MSLTRKLLLSFAGLALALVVLSAAMISGFVSMKGSLEHIAHKTGAKQFLAARFEADVQSMRASQRGLELYTLGKNPAKVEAAKQAYFARYAKAQEALKQIEALGVSPEEADLIKQSRAGLVEVDQYLSEIIRFCSVGDGDSAARLSASKTVSPFDLAAKPALQLVDMENQRLREREDSALASMDRSLWVGGVLAVLGILTGVIVLRAIVLLSATLRNTAQSLFEGADQVSSASGQISSSSQSLAQGASQHAAALAETSCSAVEIHAMTERNSDNSRMAAAFMDESARHVSISNDRLREMVNSMAEINGSSQKISNIIKVIDQIAFQTNILALNAAVESARAGEAGLGFAVVADEVRNLAQRCTQAAKDTASLIEESISKTSEGSKKLSEVEASIAHLTEHTEQVRSLVAEVKVASLEQSRGLAQIKRSISELEQVTQVTAASAEEGAAAGEQLNAQSDSLKGISEGLMLIVNGR